MLLVKGEPRVPHTCLRGAQEARLPRHIKLLLIPVLLSLVHLDAELSRLLNLLLPLVSAAECGGLRGLGGLETLLIIGAGVLTARGGHVPQRRVVELSPLQSGPLLVRL